MNTPKPLIKFNSLQYAIGLERQEIDETIKRVIDKGIFVGGEEVEAFEDDIKKYLGTKYAISCASGTDALILTLLVAQEYTNARDVITQANSAPATVAAILKAGCNPIFVDINCNGLINQEQVIAKVDCRTLAIMPVCLYGQVDFTRKYKQLYDFTHDYSDLVIIEDAAQALGTDRLKETKPWAKCISFYPTKNLGAFGDGGIIATNSEQVNNMARSLKNYGMNDKRNIKHEGGFNSRLDTLQASILRVRLKWLDQHNETRRLLAKMYNLLLPEKVKHREYREDENFHLYTIRTEDRERLQAHLLERGIETMVHYPRPATLYGIFHNPNSLPIMLPETHKFCNEVLSLPMYPGLTMQEVSHICYGITSFFDHL